MKNRRLVIGVFLLVAVLCLGVGFAALQDTLTVNGTLNFNPESTEVEKEFDADVYFSAANKDAVNSTAKDMEKVTANVDAGNNDNLVISVADDAFTAIGQKAIIKATVTNDSLGKVDIAVDATKTTNTTDAFTVTCVIADSATEIAAQGTVDVEITITLDKLAEVNDATFSFTLVATPAN